MDSVLMLGDLLWQLKALGLPDDTKVHVFDPQGHSFDIASVAGHRYTSEGLFHVDIRLTR